MLDKYTTAELNEKDKTVITKEAYAVCEYLEKIFEKLRENK